MKSRISVTMILFLAYAFLAGCGPAASGSKGAQKPDGGGAVSGVAPSLQEAGSAPRAPKGMPKPATAAPVPAETPAPTLPPTDLPPTAPSAGGPCGAFGAVLNIYNPRDVTEDIGQIDGARFSNEALTLKGARVEITAHVIDWQHVVTGQVDGTLLLVAIAGDDGESYQATVYLPDQGMGTLQYPPGIEIKVTGKHFGYVQVPSNLFASFPNSEGQALPSMAAEMAEGSC